LFSTIIEIPTLESHSVQVTTSLDLSKWPKNLYAHSICQKQHASIVINHNTSSSLSHIKHLWDGLVVVDHSSAQDYGTCSFKIPMDPSSALLNKSFQTTHGSAPLIPIVSNKPHGQAMNAKD
jgi:hypothetical protein